MWIARLLANRLVERARIMEPFARERLGEAAANGQTVVVSVDQTDLGERALLLTWAVAAGAADLGFDAQRALLEIVLGWLAVSATVLLAADRFYPSAALLTWLQAQGWGYRLRLKGYHVVDVGRGNITYTVDLARGVTVHLEPGARLFQDGIETNIGVWHEPGHAEPWIIAMECPPNPTAVRDEGCAGASSQCSRTSKVAASAWKILLNCAVPSGSRVWSSFSPSRCTGASKPAAATLTNRPLLSKKNRGATRPRALEPAQTRPFLSVVVPARIKKGLASGRVGASAAQLRSPAYSGPQPLRLN
jgi:hypothetical protein